MELVAQLGHEAMSLREVQRRAGVSPAAAYRHYRDREALLLAVGRRASALLADHLQAAVGDFQQAPGNSATDSSIGEGAEEALARLRRGCVAYVDFARQQPHLFRSVFLTGERPEQLAEPDEESLGTAGRGPYQVLQDCLADLVTVGELAPEDLPWSDTAIWSASHGLSVLMLDGPLRFLDDEQCTAATQRLLDIVLGGLTRQRHR